MSPRRPLSGSEIGAAGLFAVAVVTRIYDAIALPPMRDFDAAGHILSTAALYRGHLPDPAAWQGFHPPLYYALGGSLWHVLPEFVPLHVGLRLISVAAGVAACVLVWSALRRFFSREDSAVATVAVFAVPAVVVSTAMLGNEALCAVFSTAVLARLVPSRDAAPVGARHAFVTGLLAGAAALTKATGLLTIPVAALAYAIRRGGGARPAVRAAAVAAVTAGVLCAPHYVALAIRTGSALSIVSASGSARDAERFMSMQPPGSRDLGHYLRIPAATLLRPEHQAPGLHDSVPGLLYAAAWGDAHGHYLPLGDARLARARPILAFAGLLPTLLLLVGAVRAVRSPPTRRAFGASLAFAAVLVASLLVYAWVVPYYSAVKAGYLLPCLLPFAALLAASIDGRPPRTAAALRAALLGVAALGIGLTTYGWWA